MTLRSREQSPLCGQLSALTQFITSVAPPQEADNAASFMARPRARSSRARLTLTGFFTSIASLEVAYWGNEAFVDSACAGTITFN